MIALSFSCSKKKKDEITTPKTAFEAIPVNQYYSSDPIPDSLKSIYGKWKFLDYFGSIAGTSEKGDFDFLLLKNNGIYGITRNDSLISNGKLDIRNSNGVVAIDFIPSKSSLKPYLSGFLKSPTFKTSDTLFLSDPCCDLYSYRFARVR